MTGSQLVRHQSVARGEDKRCVYAYDSKLDNTQSGVAHEGTAPGPQSWRA